MSLREWKNDSVSLLFLILRGIAFLLVLVAFWSLRIFLGLSGWRYWLGGGLLALAAAVGIGMFIINRNDRRKAQQFHGREAKGLCVKCGYDLRATPSICPECGTRPRGYVPPGVGVVNLVTAGKDREQQKSALIVSKGRETERPESNLGRNDA